MIHNILTENFTTCVCLTNRTHFTKYVLQEGVIAYFELRPVSGGYTLTLGMTNGDDDTGSDYDIEFKELVTFNHLKEKLFLDSISILDVIQAALKTNHPTPEEVFNKGLAIGFSKGAEVMFMDREDDLEFIVVSGQYTASVCIHRSDIPAWAFARD